MGNKTVTFCVFFQFLTMFNTIVGAGAVGAGAALRYGSGSDRLRNTGFDNGSLNNDRKQSGMLGIKEKKKSSIPLIFFSSF
jgi:hypothetical protein